MLDDKDGVPTPFETDEMSKIDLNDPKLAWVNSSYSMNEICASLDISPDLVKLDFAKTWPDRVHYFFK